MEQKALKIGEPIPRLDACNKVTGQERYAADYYGDGCLWTGAKRAGEPHAVIRDIHIQEARKLRGVIAVLTHRDIQGSNRQGVVRKDHPVLADRKIRHCGEAVALVIAESRDALREALGLIRVDMEPLPCVLDPEEALREGAPLVHEDHPGGNLLREVLIRTGDPEKAFQDSDAVVEACFEVPSQEHAYLETEAGWACFGADGRLVIVASTQTPFRDRIEMAHALGMELEKIRVIAPYLGGAFGGKDGITVQCLLGLAALHCKGRPVKMHWDREESFLAGVKRLPARMYYRLGAKRDGTLHALQCRLYFNAGAYAGLCGEIMTLGIEHAGGAYRIPNVSIQGLCVYTNHPIGGPFRGFGVPQVTAAIEQMVDLLAKNLNMDPLGIRLHNVVERGDKNCIGIMLEYSTGAKECLEVVAGHPLWKKKETWKKAAGAFKRRGIGLACLVHAMGYPSEVPDYANAKIELTDEGKIRVYAGVVDMGQGNASTYLQIAGEIFGQSPAEMELVLPDTEKTLPSGSASASRCTYVYGNALFQAAQSLKQRILSASLGLFPEKEIDKLAFSRGKIRHALTGREISLKEIAEGVDPSERLCTAYFRAPAAREGSETLYMGPHCLFSYGAHLVFIEVDELTGEIEVKQYLAITDAGKVLNPQVYDQQIQGGIAQGIGYALSEDLIVKDGHIETKDLATYIVPTSLDIPETVSVRVELGEQTGPFGMKGVGEISINGPLPAISNAIDDACRLRLFQAPFTAERMLKAILDRKVAGA